MLENQLINVIKLEASKKGVHLWRNNVGATYTADGAFLRYGLANESAQVNKVIKSSDLIGLRPILITPEMVGYTIGQFVAREVKKTNWRFTGTPREEAQLRFINLINSMGGNACFDTGGNTF